jgi:hypothetical protein
VHRSKARRVNVVKGCLRWLADRSAHRQTLSSFAAHLHTCHDDHLCEQHMNTTEQTGAFFQRFEQDLKI